MKPARRSWPNFSELASRQKESAELPTAIGVMEAKAADIALLKRGNHLSPGNTVSRRFPKVLADKTQPAMPTAESGRRELANWLTRPDHPLTARVFVNRVWRWHFGQGIVRSVDNFGRLGEKPSHPELLDWLARRFIDDNWSIKKLHRLILLSSTYRQSSPSGPDSRPVRRAIRTTVCYRGFRAAVSTRKRCGMQSSQSPAARSYGRWTSDHACQEPRVSVRSHVEGRHQVRQPPPHGLPTCRAQQFV